MVCVAVSVPASEARADVSHGGYQPGSDPREWQSPGPNPYPQGSGYDQPGYGQPGYDQGYAQPGYDQGYAQPGYDQGYGQPGYGQEGYAQPGYADPGYAQPGQAAPGWQNAYDQAAYGVDQQAYGAPGYGQPYPPPPRNDGLRTHAIIALVITIVLALSCYVSLGGIAGAILSGIALSKVDTQPETARGLLRWAWVAVGINVGLIAALFVFGISLAITGA
ncbi:hypothetical protein GCM10010106_28880 [Thermopolyspora flexuosa]|jgi:hypothetical protein|nr:hypothetical protein GCM10010106_28880 [Thermopolyspora flexuosa]